MKKILTPEQALNNLYFAQAKAPLTQVERDAVLESIDILKDIISPNKEKPKPMTKADPLWEDIKEEKEEKIVDKKN